MYAIASLLDPKSDLQVKRYWEQFELLCGLTGIRTTPVPHISWMSAESYQVDRVTEVLTTFAAAANPLLVHTAGIGIFTGRQPVVYITLVKDEYLARLHKAIWEATLPFTHNPNRYYHPMMWVPHITLANYEIDPGRLGCAIEHTVFEELDFDILIQDFAILFREDGTSGLLTSIPFQNSFVNPGGIR